MQRVFRDRSSAGQELGHALRGLRTANPLILAIPHGGAPVAAGVAHVLGGDLGVIVTRKLLSPVDHHVTLGAVTADGAVCLDDDCIARVAEPWERVDHELRLRTQEACEREAWFSASLPQHSPVGRTVIVVDEGLISGSSMRAALRALRKRGASRLIAAAPVAALNACRALKNDVDEAVFLDRPARIDSLDAHYGFFPMVAAETALASLRLRDRLGAMPRAMDRAYALERDLARARSRNDPLSS
jgi:putative phosphoribosyl transferase